MTAFFLRNYTLEPIADSLRRACAAHGMEVDATFSGYDTYLQEVLDPASTFRTGAHEVVVLSLWLDSLPGAWTAAGELDTGAILAHLQEVLSLIRAATSARVLVTTFLRPFAGVASLHDGPLALLNTEVRARAAKMTGVATLDLAALAAALGAGRSADARYWYLYRSPLKPELLEAAAEVIAATIATAKGRGKKVLVLDCDDTLWGGVIGESGVDGIALSANEHPGNVFHAFQRQVVALGRAGVMLALASKNNEADVMEVLDRHPACLLRREQLAAWEISWSSKVEGLRRLAEKLKVGLDSFVFVDDSPVECAAVRAALPMVEVLQVPAKRYELPSLLVSYRGFAPEGTAEDRTRASSYQAEKARTEEAARYESVEAFLASLGLSIAVGRLRREDLPRVAQLMQRTNQFNLTTRRHGEAELEAAMAREDSLLLTLGVRDRFGDYGLTGVAHLLREGESARVESLLLSCRVLGRRVEDAFLGEVVRRAVGVWGSQTVVGEYLPTKKNEQTADFYPKRGFRALPGAGRRVGERYVLSVEAVAPAPDFIEVLRRE